MISDRCGLIGNNVDQPIIQVGDERSIVSNDVYHKLQQYKVSTQTVTRVSVEQLLEIDHSDANFIVSVEDRQLKNIAVDHISKNCWNQLSIVMENCNIMPDVILGKGVIIFPMTVILSNSVIGDYTQIYPFSAIGHVCNIGASTVIQGGCFVGGSTIIGDNCTLGLRSNIATHTNLPSNSTLGAFSSLTKTPDSAGNFVGTPARRVSSVT
jgi:UDP-3-O-[3-hydroxymyristoyl] glucosamine N-acyltransferase